MSARLITVIAFGAFTWVACLVAAFAALQHYSTIPGRAASPALGGSDFLAAHRQPGRGLLVIAVHPHCPCTRASLAEMGDLLARSGGACDAVILEFHPAQPESGWAQSPSTREIGPYRAPVIVDRGGRIATQIGAHTSGHVVFIDASGRTRFHGGLTLARGHRGRSPAQDAILAVLKGGQPALQAAPVYGCALLAECKAPPAQ